MIILDTNVLSEVMKPVPAPATASWMARQTAGDLYTTAVTEAEILLGVALLPDGRRKQGLEAGARRVFGLFTSRILPFDTSAAQVFAEIVAERRRTGRPIGSFDAQIAAIARSRGMALATRNGPDFISIGVTVIDPWRA
ncbi:MAG: type II toxin-antitoxin system VapC family toxin [Rhodomicrobium sp.]|nr:type II toxin-antitoxin system VapC family toxin [Rhodomicrobium sp.]